MLGNQASKPIAAILPAVEGWRALFIKYDAGGKPVDMPGDSGSVVVAPPVVIAAWGLLVPDPDIGVMGALAAMAGVTPREGAAFVPLAAADAGAERLDARRGYIGFAYPGESAQEAVARIDRPERPHPHMEIP
jgi:hypothetical protein